MMSHFTACLTIAGRSVAIVPWSTRSANRSVVVEGQSQVWGLQGQGLALGPVSVEPASAKEVLAGTSAAIQQAAFLQAQVGEDLEVAFQQVVILQAVIPPVESLEAPMMACQGIGPEQLLFLLRKPRRLQVH